jgi:2,3-bisphosphoglycerate-independent phosphoglycerate mutase
MKIILILLDGLGDRSYSVLNGLTPLQDALTPNLDRLAYLGCNGLFHAASLGQCLPSETAHYLLFGYDRKNFPGRGLLEAVGDGVAFDDGDVLCLAHLSGVDLRDGIPILAHGREDIEGTAQEMAKLYAAITPYETHGITFRLHQTRRNDAILILKGNVSPHVSDSDPMIRGRAMARIRPFLNNPEPERAKRTARALNDYLSYCHRVLSNHQLNRQRRDRALVPANFLATQRCGRRIIQQPFRRQWGLNGMLIASQAVYIGLANELGLDSFRANDTKDPAQDIRERIQMALADTAHDFIHVHTKAPDEAAHKGGPNKKAAAIASLDTGLEELVREVEARDDLLVAVTADHSTPSMSALIHSGEPVPVAIVGQSIRRDNVAAFDEISAATGCLGFLRGPELMLMLLNYADRSALLGHRLGEAELPYITEEFEPFQLTN